MEIVLYLLGVSLGNRSAVFGNDQEFVQTQMGLPWAWRKDDGDGVLASGLRKRPDVGEFHFENLVRGEVVGAEQKDENLGLLPC
jgi:hypothetical protein